MATSNTVGAVLTGIICVSGFIAISVYMYVILKFRRSAFSNSFYTFTISLAAPEFFSNILTLLYGVPIMYQNRHVLVNGTITDPVLPCYIRSILGISSDYFWFSICAHSVVIALNRIVAVTWPCNYDLIFSSKRVTIICLMSHLVALIIPIAEYLCSCYYEFAQVGWTVLCVDEASACAARAFLADQVYSMGSVVFVVLSNAYILAYVFYAKLKNKPNGMTQQDRFKRELGMAFQFAAVAAIMVIGNISFWVMPAMVESGLIEGGLAGLSATVFFTLQCAINPFIYFTFGSDVREKLTTIMACKKKTAKVNTARLTNVA